MYEKLSNTEKLSHRLINKKELFKNKYVKERILQFIHQ